jgi:lysophospholipase L1-like esterase
LVQLAHDIRSAAHRAGRALAVGLGATVVLVGLTAAVRAGGAKPADRPSELVADADARCRIGADAHAFRPVLPMVRLEVQERGRLTIVALGSSSTEGVGASDPEHSYPALLRAELAERLPNIAVTVINAGIGGQVAHDMLMRLDSDVVAKRPSLVIWQTGVNDAIRDVGTDRLVRILQRGIGRLRATGSDIVLMDLQWLPQAERYPQYELYRDALAETAAAAGVDVFPRYDMMRDWAQSGQFDAADLIGGDRLHMSDVSYRCLATRIADGVVAAVEGVQPPPLLSGNPRRGLPAGR